MLLKKVSFKGKDIKLSNDTEIRQKKNEGRSCRVSTEAFKSPVLAGRGDWELREGKSNTGEAVGKQWSRDSPVLGSIFAKIVVKAWKGWSVERGLSSCSY